MKEVKVIQNRASQAPRQSMTLSDVYYVLFRQKWKIIFFCLLGVGLAAYLYKEKPPMYESDAKLLVRYVVEKGRLQPSDDDTKTRIADDQGANIISSEIEILTSYDLAKQVAELVGPERILAKNGGGKDLDGAADLIAGNMVVDSPTKGSVMRVAFRSLNPDIVQPVLHQIVESYLKKHVQVHDMPGEFDDFLSSQIDQLRAQLQQTERDLVKAKEAVGVINLEETRKNFTIEISKIRQSLFETDAELAQRKAVLQAMEGHGAPVMSKGNDLVVPLKSADVDEYKSVAGRLENLHKRLDALLTQYTEENSLVKGVRAQILENEKIQAKLEDRNPRLAAMSVTPAGTDRTGAPGLDYNLEAAKIVALQTKRQVLNDELGQIRGDATNMDSSEAMIAELQRKRDLEENNYKYMTSTLAKSRFDAALGAGRNSNISVIQTPSPPFRDGAKVFKTPLAALIGCIAAGFVVAFLMELQIDNSVKRPVDIEGKLHLPLFLSIPRVKMSSPARLKELAAAEQAQLGNGNSPHDASENSGLEKRAATSGGLWSRDPALNPYYEALRDRIILDFELRELTHTPKLIAVTGCDHGSGVTTVALGLAASLSETGAGNVLLVDMNREPAAAQQFYKGRTVCELDEALKAKDSALTHNNLYVVTEGAGNDNVPRMMPKRFANLVPKLRASDYDYIIFDMPPVSPTSVTPRVAGFMDQVLLVMESEKTSRDTVQKATGLLAESKASVSAVLNKTRTYVPPMLQKEF